MKKGGVQNLDKFKRQLEKRVIKNTQKEVKNLVQRSATLVENTAKKSILSGGSGITYKKYNPRRTHTASAPGQPPASDTGFLVNSISTSVSVRGTSVIGQIVASAEYAPHLEFGTSSILPRPFMQPALERNRNNIRRIFKAGKYLD